jgi:His/Glu/Gln/Arg/opine family amino acid ABC transporter permease subunit
VGADRSDRRPGYTWDFSFLWAYRWLILTGLGVTIAYTVGTIFLGLVIGLVTGLLRVSRNPMITAPLVAYVEIFRCTPLLVQIVWFYYVLPVVLGIDIPAHVAAVLVLSLSEAGPGARDREYKLNLAGVGERRTRPHSAQRTRTPTSSEFMITTA